MPNRILKRRVLGRVEKNSFIAFQAKGDTAGSCPSKALCPHLRGFSEESYSNGSGLGLLKRLGSVQGLYSFNMVSGNLSF